MEKALEKVATQFQHAENKVVWGDASKGHCDERKEDVHAFIFYTVFAKLKFVKYANFKRSSAQEREAKRRKKGCASYHIKTENMGSTQGAQGAVNTQNGACENVHVKRVIEKSVAKLKIKTH